MGQREVITTIADGQFQLFFRLTILLLANERHTQVVVSGRIFVD